MKKSIGISSVGYRRSEICTLLGVSERTFDRMREGGTFPAPDMRTGNGRILLWLKRTVDEWVSAQSGSPSRSRSRERATPR